MMNALFGVHRGLALFGSMGPTLNRFLKFSVIVAGRVGGRPFIRMDGVRRRHRRTETVQTVPSVAGEVIEVPVRRRSSGQAIGLFGTTFDDPSGLGRRIEAQPVRGAAPRPSHVQPMECRFRPCSSTCAAARSEVDQFKAQLDGAKWNLDRPPCGRAPADGYVTNPAPEGWSRRNRQMVFIDTSEIIFAVAIPVIYTRYAEVGQPIEVTFKTEPVAVHNQGGRDHPASGGERSDADSASPSRRRRSRRSPVYRLDQARR